MHAFSKRIFRGQSKPPLYMRTRHLLRLPHHGRHDQSQDENRQPAIKVKSDNLQHYPLNPVDLR